jgi:hypothetical protein
LYKQIAKGASLTEAPFFIRNKNVILRHNPQGMTRFSCPAADIWLTKNVKFRINYSKQLHLYRFFTFLIVIYRIAQIVRAEPSPIHKIFI